MKKGKKALIILFVTVLFGIAILPVLPFLLIAGLQHEAAAMNEVSKQTLTALGVTEVDAYTTWHVLTIDGQLTAFKVSADAFDSAEGWISSPVTAAEYAEQLRTYAPEAAFLLPRADVTFDRVHLGDGTSIAWYDADTELLIRWDAQKTPKRGAVRLDSLKVAHSGWVYECETHGGFHGDGTTFLAFIVPEEERAALEARLTTQEGWMPCAVTQAEYAAFQERVFYEVPPLFPAEDIVFDYCCYVDTFARRYPDHEHTTLLGNSAFPAALREVGAHQAGNWLTAFYDADTGLLIYYEYDS